jgi:AraC-like DNA-binding protein
MPTWPKSTDHSGLGMREGNVHAVSRADRLPSTAGGMTRLAYARAKAAGIALDPLLKRAGLTHRVRLIRHRAQNAEFAKFFGDNIEFNAAADEMTFSKNIRQFSVVGADPHLNKLLISYCEEAIAHRPKARGSFRSRVETAVAPLLPHGKAQASEIARQLGVSQRTFARRLSDEGLSFSQLLNSLRSDLANRHWSTGIWPFHKLHGCLAIETSGHSRMLSSGGPARRRGRRARKVWLK